MSFQDIFLVLFYSLKLMITSALCAKALAARNTNANMTNVSEL